MNNNIKENNQVVDAIVNDQVKESRDALIKAYIDLLHKQFDEIKNAFATGKFNYVIDSLINDPLENIIKKLDQKDVVAYFILVVNAPTFLCSSIMDVIYQKSFTSLKELPALLIESSDVVDKHNEKINEKTE